MFCTLTDMISIHVDVMCLPAGICTPTYRIFIGSMCIPVYTFSTLTDMNSIPIIIIIIIIKRGWQCKAGREQLTPYQSEDPNPTTPTHRKRRERENSRRQKVSEQLGQ